MIYGFHVSGRVHHHQDSPAAYLPYLGVRAIRHVVTRWPPLPAKGTRIQLAGTSPGIHRRSDEPRISRIRCRNPDAIRRVEPRRRFRPAHRARNDLRPCCSPVSRKNRHPRMRRDRTTAHTRDTDVFRGRPGWTSDRCWQLAMSRLRPGWKVACVIEQSLLWPCFAQARPVVLDGLARAGLHARQATRAFRSSSAPAPRLSGEVMTGRHRAVRPSCGSSGRANWCHPAEARRRWRRFDPPPRQPG